MSGNEPVAVLNLWDPRPCGGRHTFHTKTAVLMSDADFVCPDGSPLEGLEDLSLSFTSVVRLPKEWHPWGGAAALIKLDTRGYGPASCEACDADVEEAILMGDASLMCPDCRTEMEGFDIFQELFNAAAPVRPGDFPDLG